MRRIYGALFAALVVMGSAPASAGRFLSISDYDAAMATLRKVNKVPEIDRPAYMAAHRKELEAATIVASQAAVTWDTLEEANKYALGRYLHPFLCGMPVEEDTPDVTYDDLMRIYLDKVRAARNIKKGSADDKKLGNTPIHIAMLDSMMDRFACPGK